GGVTVRIRRVPDPDDHALARSALDRRAPGLRIRWLRDAGGDRGLHDVVADVLLPAMSDGVAPHELERLLRPSGDLAIGAGGRLVDAVLGRALRARGWIQMDETRDFTYRLRIEEHPARAQHASNESADRDRAVRAESTRPARALGRRLARARGRCFQVGKEISSAHATRRSSSSWPGSIASRFARS